MIEGTKQLNEFPATSSVSGDDLLYSASTISGLEQRTTVSQLQTFVQAPIAQSALDDLGAITGDETIPVGSSGLYQTTVNALADFIANIVAAGSAAATLTQQSFTTGAAFTGTIAGNILTVANVLQGTVTLGQTVYGSGVAAGTTITAKGSGTGGAGTYAVSVSQNLGPIAMGSATSNQFAPGVQASITLGTNYGGALVFFDSALQTDCTVANGVLTLNPYVPVGVNQVTIMGGVSNVFSLPVFGQTMLNWLNGLSTEEPTQAGVWWNNGGTLSQS